MAIYRRSATGEFERYEQSDLWTMGKLEWDLEQWLAANRQLLFPNDNVFIFGRQARLGPGGISDILGFDEMGNLYVIELKRGVHGRQCIAQALDYVSELAEWEYGDFKALWRQYEKSLGQSALELRQAHAEFHDLSEPLRESEFNQSQYIVIVSEGPDEKAERIADWLKNVDIPIYYSTFSIHQSTKRKREFLIDVSEVEVASGGRTPEFGNDFWLNSDEKYFPGSYVKMLKCGLACTYGPLEYGQKLEPLEKSSRVFLYVNRMGIAAEGVVQEPWSGKKNKMPLTIAKGCPEYSVAVKWNQVAERAEQAVNATEIIALGHKLFVPTCFRISKQLAQQLSQRLKEKCGKLRSR